MHPIIPERHPRHAEPAGNQWPAHAAVLSIECPLCSAPADASCGLASSHLSRWLRTYALTLITRGELVDAVRGLVVISASQLVGERAA